MMRRAVPYVVLGAGAFFAVYPFLWMIGTSFKSLPEATVPSLSLLPEQWLWRNYVETFQAAPFGRYFFNTFLVASIVTAAVVLTSLSAGYVLARVPFRGRGAVFTLVLATMMIPFEMALIPNFMLISKLGWYDTYAALIVPWCASAFAVFLVRQAFLAVPGDYYDAAVLDGCGHLRFLAYVAAPLIRPSLVTVAVFAFLGSYNALLWPLVVTGDDRMRVVQVGLTVFSSAEGVRVNLLMCASVIVILPTVALYFLAQRHFLEGALGAGLKG